MDLFSEEAKQAFAVQPKAAKQDKKDEDAEGQQDSEADSSDAVESESEGTAKEAGKKNKQGKQGKKGSKPVKRGRDPEADARTVFAGNVPLKAKKGAVKKYFSPFGKVESVRFRSIPITGAKVAVAGDHSLVRRVSAIQGNLDTERRNSQNAYIVFADRADALRAIEALNGEKYEEHRLRLDMADKSTGLQDHRKSVFICNFPSAMSEDDLWEYFEAKLGGGSAAEKGRVVVGVRVVRDPKTQRCKGFGYLHLASPAYAAAALALHKTQLRKRELRVFPCRLEKKAPSAYVSRPARHRRCLLCVFDDFIVV